MLRTTPLLLLLFTSSALAQDPPEEQQGYFSLGLGSEDRDGRNVAFGHTGSRVVIAPSIGEVGSSNNFSLANIELRLDTHDQLLEWGIPMLASVGFENEDMEVGLVTGLEHLGASHKLGDLSDVRLSTQFAAYLSFRAKISTWLTSRAKAGGRSYSVASGATPGIERTWWFAQGEVEATLAPNLSVGVNAQGQIWQDAMPRDRFLTGTSSLTLQTQATWDATRDLSVLGRIGTRWDQDGKTRSDFVGVDVLWSPRIFEVEDTTNTPSEDAED